MSRGSEVSRMDRGTEQALLDRCRKGEAAAFDPIVREYEAPLLRLLNQISGDAKEATAS